MCGRGVPCVGRLASALHRELFARPVVPPPCLSPSGWPSGCPVRPASHTLASVTPTYVFCTSIDVLLPTPPPQPHAYTHPTWTHKEACPHRHTHTQAHMNVHTHTYAGTYECTHTHTHTHACIHTHTHTPTSDTS